MAKKVDYMKILKRKHYEERTEGKKDRIEREERARADSIATRKSESIALYGEAVAQELARIFLDRLEMGHLTYEIQRLGLGGNEHYAIERLIVHSKMREVKTTVQGKTVITTKYSWMNAGITFITGFMPDEQIKAEFSQFVENRAIEIINERIADPRIVIETFVLEPPNPFQEEYPNRKRVIGIKTPLNFD